MWSRERKDHLILTKKKQTIDGLLEPLAWCQAAMKRVCGSDYGLMKM